MKPKISLIALLLAFVVVTAQAQRPMPGSYIINHDIDKFEGNWEWQSGTEKVTIVLKKVKYTFNHGPKEFYKDVLIGCHRYKKNGVVIQNTMNTWPAIAGGDFRKASILGWAVEDDPNKAEFSVRDLSKNKRVKLFLSFDAESPAKVTWPMMVQQGVLSGRSQTGLTMPANLILTKQ